MEIVTGRIRDDRIMVPVDQLGEALTRLPISAWPYGLVVGAQDASVIDSAVGIEPIDRNHRAVVEVLGAMGIAVWWWPS